MPTIQFDTGSSEGKRAIVVSFDLSGFSVFCNHPEAHAILPKFIAGIFTELNSVFIGSLQEFIEGIKPETGLVPAPQFIKYTGDGALMIWLAPEDTHERQQYCTAIVSAMRRFRKQLTDAIPKWEILWQINHLPQPARFGIAAGLVYPLREPGLGFHDGEIQDYAGYCINLAVRLQDHCPEIGFLIHELVFPNLKGLVKFIASGMKGTQPEPVLIFAEDIPSLPLIYFRTKLLPCGEESKARCEATQREHIQSLNFSDPDQRILSQPRFEAFLVGPEKWHQHAILDETPLNYQIFRDIKDDSGKVIGEELHEYKRTSLGPPVIYTFVKKLPWPPPDSPQ